MAGLSQPHRNRRWQKYDLLSTISQYSEDASDEWKEMYDTYLDTINGIRIMDGCS